MNEIIYQALSDYYRTLEVKGYMSDIHSYKLLLLCFYRDFVYNDYQGLITKEDYHLIEKALDCLYGTTCLIPYPNYLTMGKLHLGEISELAHRVKKIENTPVLKLLDVTESTEVDSDVLVIQSEE